MKAHTLFKGLSILLVLNIAIKPLWIFAIDRQVQNVVGNTAYGVYFSLFNLSVIFLFMADAGLSNMLTQKAAAQKAFNCFQLLRLKSVLLVLYLLTCCAAAWLSQIKQWNIFLYLITIQAISSLTLFLRGLLTANQYFKTDAFFSVLDKSLLIVFCAPFLYGWWQPITLQLFLQLQVGAAVVACLLVTTVLLKKKISFGADKEKATSILTSTLPFAIIILLMGMHYRLDGFLLERLHSDGALQAGIYAASYRLLDAANMPGYLAASFLVPFIARNRNQQPLVNNTVVSIQHMLVLSAVCVSCFAWVFALFIQQALYNTSDAYNVTITRLCLAVLPAYYVTHIYGSALTAIAGFKSFITLLTLSVLLNILLNLFLIPLYGAWGCCIAAISSQYFCAVTCYLSATKQLAISRSIKPWMVYAVTALLLLALMQLLKSRF